MSTANPLSTLQPLVAGTASRGSSVTFPMPPGAVTETTDVGTSRPVATLGIPGRAAVSDQPDPKDRYQVAEAVKSINEFFQTVRRTLEFSVDDKSGRVVIQIKDAETQEVIRQIPPEEVLELQSRMHEFRGLLLRESA